MSPVHQKLGRTYFLLSGIMRCPNCGTSMSGEHNRGYTYYGCATRRAKRYPKAHRCPIKMHRAEAVESCVIQAVLEGARRPERMTDALRAYERQQASIGPEEAKRLQKELTALDAEEKAVVKAQVAGIQAGARPDTYAVLFTEIAQKRQALQARLDQLAVVRQPDRSPRAAAEKFAYVLGELETALTSEALTVAEKRSLLTTVVRAVRPETKGYWVDLYSSVGFLGTVQYISIR
jgi:hypothetical protein